MGHWVIHIEGHGIHDNGREDDADSMARDFAGKLRVAGHDVHAVSFTSGATKTLPVASTGSVEAPPEDYQYRP
jgi:hypothetical protein